MADDIYAKIRALIADGAYLGGDAIPESELAARLGVSRTPIREAMRRLQAEGLDEAQKQLVRELMAEAPLQVMSRLQKAEKLEQAIANDVLYRRQGVADIKSRLDELVRLKREATEAQIATVKRIQAAISEAQVRKLLKLAVADAP